MTLERIINNLKIRNKTKIKPHQSFCFNCRGENNIYLENSTYYYIVWSDGDNCLIVDYKRLYLFSIKQYLTNCGTNIIHIKKNINKKEIPVFFPIDITKGNYLFPENIEETIKKEMEKPYFL
jgi:hypothetical protein